MGRYRYGVIDTIVSCLKEKMDYRISLETNEEAILMNYIFCESNQKRLNEILNCLLEEDNDGITNCVWQYFPFNIDDYKFEGAVAEMAEKKRAVIKEAMNCDGNLYNKTPDIPFEGGYITPVSNKHKDVLLEGMKKDKENSIGREKEEYKVFISSVDDANRSDGTKPSFAIIMNDIGVVGYISLTEGGFFSMRRSPSKTTYNLEYYILPEHRRKGYLKRSLPVFLDAVKRKQIEVTYEQPMFSYGVKKEVLPIKIINALVFKDNVASVKSIESLNMFEHTGAIRYVSTDMEVEEVECYSIVI